MYLPKPKLMDYSHFFDLKELAVNVLTNKRKNTRGVLINWLNVRWIRVQKSSPDEIFFKTDFDQVDFDVMVPMRKSRSRSLFSLNPAYRYASVY